MTIETIQDKIDAQRRFCQEKQVPHFAPDDGVCWACRENIYREISLKIASSEHITGCPCCCRTYCD